MTTEEERQKRFGEWLALERESYGYGLRQMSDLIGYSMAWISRLERGDVQPSRKFVTDISRILGFDEDVVLARAGLVPLDLIDLIQREPFLIRAILQNMGLARDRPLPDWGQVKRAVTGAVTEVDDDLDEMDPHEEDEWRT